MVINDIHLGQCLLQYCWATKKLEKDKKKYGLAVASGTSCWHSCLFANLFLIQYMAASMVV